MLRFIGWAEAADLIVKGVDGAISAKVFACNFDGRLRVRSYGSVRSLEVKRSAIGTKHCRIQYGQPP